MKTEKLHEYIEETEFQGDINMEDSIHLKDSMMSMIPIQDILGTHDIGELYHFINKNRFTIHKMETGNTGCNQELIDEVKEVIRMAQQEIDYIFNSN